MVEQTLGTPAQNSPEQLITEKVKELNTRVRLLSLFLVGAIIVIVGLFLRQDQRVVKEPSLVVPPGTEDTPLNEVVENPAKNLYFTFTEDPEKRIMFAKKAADYEQSFDLEYWTMRPDGSNQQKVSLEKRAYSAFKYPNSTKVFYSVEEKYGIIFVKDLLTSKVTSFSPIKHPQPDARVGLAIQQLKNIAPDESGAVILVEFWKPCPTQTPEQQNANQGGDGGGGPCLPEEIPDLPYGYYYIDLKTQQKRFLGDIIDVSSWDLENNSLYYNTVAAFPMNYLRSFNYKTGEFVTVDSSENFGFSSNYLPKSNKKIVVTGTTGDSGGVSNSSITLFDLKTNTGKVIDTGTWADIQPFVAISPDESDFLYQKKDPQNPYPISGIPRFNLMKYDFATGQTSQLSPNTAFESYSPTGLWIDNENFIGMVSTLEEPFYNNNNYLININVKTGQITRLTQGNEVVNFINNY